MKKFSLDISKIGTVLIFLGLIVLLAVFAPVIKEEAKYQLEKPSKEVEYQIADPASPPVLTEKSVLITPTNYDFSLIVPQIGINAAVFPNIDSGNPDEYLPILKKGTAHAKYSSLPNQSGPVFIFAHSTDNFFNISQYNAVFFLLRKLKEGEDIYIFYQNKKYQYQVTSQKIVSPDEIPSVVSSIKTNTLILQTCYPPGTTINRLLLFADRVN